MSKTPVAAPPEQAQAPVAAKPAAAPQSSWSTDTQEWSSYDRRDPWGAQRALGSRRLSAPRPFANPGAAWYRELPPAPTHSNSFPIQLMPSFADVRIEQRTASPLPTMVIQAQRESDAQLPSRPGPIIRHVQASTSSDSQKSATASVNSTAEIEAERVAQGRLAGAITAQPEGVIHRLAPNHHQTATIGGLASTFSAEEIGAIYAANWERDFSQGHPLIASAVIAWTAVKNHATKHDGDPGPAAATFRDAVWKVVDANLISLGSKSLGGYETWEHMDAPDSKKVRKAADNRWAGKTASVAGYIMDSKAHIKDQMVAAIDVYREDHNTDGIGESIDNWNGVAKPDGYAAPTVSPKSTTGRATTTTLPLDWEDTNVSSRDPIREATTNQAITAGAKSNANHKAGLWRLVGQHLGRAMHAFEDFWAHSNWLELAKELYEKQQVVGEMQQNISNKDLKTGTFMRPAQAHSLGHKLLALATAFQDDFDLLMRVYGRTSESTKITDEIADGKAKRLKFIEKMNRHRELREYSEMNRYNVLSLSGLYYIYDKAFAPLEKDSPSTLGELIDVGVAVDNVEELVQSGGYKMEDFLSNRAFLDAVAKKGELLIKQGDENSDENSHGHIAKDQREGDGRKDHDGAMRLAVEANEIVFGPLREIMSVEDSAQALVATQKQLAMIDSMIQVPSRSHPLWGSVVTIMERRNPNRG